MSDPNEYIMHIPTEAVRDICMYVEDMIFKRRLTEEEKHALSIKVRFWIHMTRTHGDHFDMAERKVAPAVPKKPELLEIHSITPPSPELLAMLEDIRSLPFHPHNP